ncbi:MAG: YifB family Mg chelatase-like AAA ATPase [Candidatus Colwellbacteria bacterium]|nr:YifB family Mg chelatase-like AAA ATPase [Candidatus Colwellbacteria bacterium]
MLAKVFSGATTGLSGVPIEVEVDVAAGGLPSFTIVGLPDKAVEEAKERVRAAIKNSGADFPPRKITVNLAPADLPKEGPAFDLPIAIGLLAAEGQLNVTKFSDSLFLGELSLDGSLRHTAGILPMALLAKELKFKNIFLPQVNASEAAVIAGIKVYGVENLLSLFRHLTGLTTLIPTKTIPFRKLEFDFSEVQGQESVKRALEIAAAGGHNVFMKGVPGAGKTMLARSFAGILPHLTEDEAMEVTKIYSITGNLSPGQSVVRHRPFRSPHHTTSRNGLIGGGTKPMPGEISLAHRGVLFLDEFPEFPRHVLEALRQPLEDGIVSISRVSGSVAYPAQFMLIAAANPCPCGYYGSPSRPCKCMPGLISRYQKRISGPILDRIDIHVEVPEVAVEKLVGKSKNAESSKMIQARVQKARNLQQARFKKAKINSNSEMTTKMVRQFCGLDAQVQKLLTAATAQLNLSARSYYKVIKVARTIADLAASKEILTTHLAEALQYRPKSENLLE